MQSLTEEFQDLIGEETPDITEDKSKEYIIMLDKFRNNDNITYSGVYKDSILECISTEESLGIPWKHVCMTIDVGKLRDISKPRLNQFNVPAFVEELRSIGDKNNSGFGYNEYGRNYVKSIIIPSSVYEIADNTFSFYKKLESVILTEDSRLSIIGDCAFTFCEELKELDLSKCKKLKELKDRLFYNSAIKKLKISGNIRKVSPYTFEGSNLSAIYIDDYKYSFKTFINKLQANDYEAFWV